MGKVDTFMVIYYIYGRHKCARNVNVPISVTNVALCDMELVHCGICVPGLLRVVEYPFPKSNKVCNQKILQLIDHTFAFFVYLIQ